MTAIYINAAEQALTPQSNIKERRKSNRKFKSPELKPLLNQVNFLNRQCRIFPRNNFLRHQLKTCVKLLKQKKKQLKKQETSEIVNKLNELKGSSPRDFWKGINKLCSRIPSKNLDISVDTLYKYYSELYQDKANSSLINRTNTEHDIKDKRSTIKMEPRTLR